MQSKTSQVIPVDNTDQDSQTALQGAVQKMLKDGKGFELLCASFGFEQVLGYLAKEFWKDRIKLAGLLRKSESFAYAKRAPGKRKTIAAYYWRAANGGAERVVTQLCNRWAAMLNEKGEPLYNVVLITDTAPMENEYELSEKVQRAFLPALAQSTKENYQNRLAAWQDLIRQYSIDVVISSQWLSPVTFWDMLAVKGAPTHPAFFIHAHNTCGLNFKLGVAQELAETYSFCDGVIALSECDELYVKSFNRNAKYIINPLPLEPDKIDPASYQPHTIVWCARISNEKKPLDVLKMMELVVQQLPEAKLYVVGGDKEDLFQAMQNKVREAGLENNVELVGFTLDVDKYYSMATVMVVTSEFEGFSLAMGEGMAHSLPIVAYDMPYLTYFRDGRGIVAVPQDNTELLAQKVVELLRNPEKAKALGAQGKQQITEICHADIEADWKELFDNLDEEKKEPENSTISIVLKHITEFQHKGKLQIVDLWTERYRKIKDDWRKSVRENRKLTANRDKAVQENKKLKKNIKAKNKQLDNIKSGWSWKIGRFLTWLPRMLLGRK